MFCPPKKPVAFHRPLSAPKPVHHHAPVDCVAGPAMRQPERPLPPHCPSHDPMIDHSVLPEYSCKNCLFFKRDCINGGVCYFEPPVVIHNEAGELESVRPSVLLSDYCAKFTEK